MPATGGIRVALVATDPTTQSGCEERSSPGRRLSPGSSCSASRARFVFEMGDEGAQRLQHPPDREHRAARRCRRAQPIVFELPADARGPGCSRDRRRKPCRRPASASPSPDRSPREHVVQFAYSVPFGGGALTLEQKLPLQLTQVSVMAQKVGDMQLASPQMAEQREMPLEGQTYIVGQGPALPAGHVLTFTFTGLPHQPVWPRNLALALASVILAAGVWASDAPARRRGDDGAASASTHAAIGCSPS